MARPTCNLPENYVPFLFHVKHLWPRLCPIAPSSLKDNDFAEVLRAPRHASRHAAGEHNLTIAMAKTGQNHSKTRGIDVF